MDTNWNDLVNMLRNFNSERFCKTIKLCVWKEVSEIYDIEKDIICPPFKVLSIMSISILEISENPIIVKNGINNVCEKMPEPLKNICRLELNAHWPDFMKMLENVNADQYCGNSKMRPSLKELSNVDNSEKCEACKLAANSIKTLLLISPDVAQTIRNTILKTCALLSRRARRICDIAVKIYWDQLINVLKTLDPHRVCQYIHLCPKGVEKEIPPMVIRKDMCTPCKLVSNIIKSILENPDISKMIRDGINKLCGKMPDPLKNMCISELKTHWQDFMNMLRTFNAEQFCRNTKMCIIWTKIPNVGNAEKCANCRIAATTFRAILVLRPDVPETLRNAIIDTCSTLRPAVKFVCMSLMNGYWYTLLNNLRHFDPYRLCQQIRMCTYRTEIRVDIEWNVYESCTMLGSVLKTVSENKHLTRELRNPLSHLCSGHGVDDLCNNKMLTNWEAWMNILQKLNIEKFCRSIDKPVVAEATLNKVLSKKI